jgi:hypothetical protein
MGGMIIFIGRRKIGTLTDTVASDTDLEGEVVERVSQEQLKSELWT